MCITWMTNNKFILSIRKKIENRNLAKRKPNVWSINIQFKKRDSQVPQTAEFARFKKGLERLWYASERTKVNIFRSVSHIRSMLVAGFELLFMANAGFIDRVSLISLANHFELY